MLHFGLNMYHKEQRQMRDMVRPMGRTRVEKDQDTKGLGRVMVSTDIGILARNYDSYRIIMYALRN